MKRKQPEEISLKVIAHVKSDFPEKFGVPRQSLRVPSLRAAVVFEEEYAVKEALRGIEGFSHLWLIWGFSHTAREKWSPTVRPPRLGGNRRMGVFATRSPNRPNPLGLSCVKLAGVISDRGRCALLVEGADMIDGTPVYDIKPYLRACDSIPDALDGFAAAFEEYALRVDFPDELLALLPEEKRPGLLGVLREDPRPSYQNDGRTYGLSYAGFEIGFYVDENKILHVIKTEKEKAK